MSGIAQLTEQFMQCGLSPGKAAEHAIRIFQAQSQYRPLHAKDLSGPTWLYVIIDPRSRKPFYIGITKYLWYRFDQHRTDPGSAAWRKLNELLYAGYTPDRIYKPYRRYPDRNAALRAEHELIISTPGLLNRSRQIPWAAYQ